MWNLNSSICKYIIEFIMQSHPNIVNKMKMPLYNITSHNDIIIVNCFFKLWKIFHFFTSYLLLVKLFLKTLGSTGKYRSSWSEVFLICWKKKLFWKRFGKFTRNHVCWGSLLELEAQVKFMEFFLWVFREFSRQLI